MSLTPQEINIIESAIPLDVNKPSELVSTRAIRRRRSRSKILEVTLRKHPIRKFILKFFATAKDAHTHFQLLEDLWEKFREHGSWFSVPRPVAVFSRMSALLMERVPGNSLDHHLLLGLPWTASQMQVLNDFMQQSGAWLRTFHNLNQRENATPVPSREFLAWNDEEFRRFLEYLEGTEGVNTRARASEEIDRLVYQSSLVHAPVSLLHGDFKPANVIISGRNTFGIDISGAFSNCIYLDIAAFLNNVDFIYANPWNWRYPRSAIKVLRKSFVEGYFGREPYSIEAIQLFRIRSFVSFLYDTQETRRTGILSDRIIRRLALRSLKRLSIKRVEENYGCI